MGVGVFESVQDDFGHDSVHVRSKEEGRTNLKDQFTQLPEFWIGFGIRLLLIPLCIGSAAPDLFLPILNFAASHPLENPWQNYSVEHFPYGSTLYLILFFPRLLFGLLFGESILEGASGIFLLKLPLIVFEFLLLRQLISDRVTRTREILLLFWLNPIVIYVSHLHVQLDIVVTYFALMSLLALRGGKVIASAFWFAFALGCKFHVAVLAPFVLAYFWQGNFKSEALRKIFLWLGIGFTLGGLLLLPPVVAGHLGGLTVASPQARRVFSVFFEVGGGIYLYLGVVLLSLLVLRLILSSRITKSGVFYGSGLILGALLLITYPSPGWFLWFIPFMVLFYNEFPFSGRLPYFLLSGVMVFHYGLVDLGFFSFANGLFTSLIFSIQQALLAFLLFYLWMFALRREVPFRFRMRPLCLGVAGDSGAGKDTLADILNHTFHSDRTITIAGDDYHYWERGDKNWQDTTPLSPKANNLPRLVAQLSELMKGRSFFQRHYDHSVGQFTEARFFKANRTVIVQGLHSLFPRALREAFDLKIFLDPDPKVQVLWKLRRDSRERGHTYQQVLESIKKRKEDSDRYIRPQSEYADLIVKFTTNENFDLKDYDRDLSLKLQCVVWNDVPLEEFSNLLRSKTRLVARSRVHESNIDRAVLEVEGEVSAGEIEEIANEIFPHIRSITRSSDPPKWEAGLQGVVQLLIILLLEMSLMGR